MSCAGVLALFTDLLEAALAADVRSSVEAHLADCAGCRRQLRDFERMIALVRRLGTEAEHEPVPARTMTVLLAAYRERQRCNGRQLRGTGYPTTRQGGTP
jgi:anti-sigma factor RsiW